MKLQELTPVCKPSEQRRVPSRRHRQPQVTPESFFYSDPRKIRFKEYLRRIDVDHV